VRCGAVQHRAVQEVARKRIFCLLIAQLAHEDVLVSRLPLIARSAHREAATWSRPRCHQRRTPILPGGDSANLHGGARFRPGTQVDNEQSLGEQRTSRQNDALCGWSGRATLAHRVASSR
jgi:hypothetical protein